jgi:hypothetical protein
VKIFKHRISQTIPEKAPPSINCCNMSYPHGQKSNYPKRHFNAS